MKNISSVEVLSHGVLRLNWKGGGYDRVILTPWMKGGRSLERISDPRVFCAVSVDIDGKRLVWGDADCSMSVEVCMSYAEAYKESCRSAEADAERRSENEIAENEQASAILESPIKFGEIDESDLSDLIEERLDALLFLYRVEPTAEGWKDLALQLAVNITMGGRSIFGRGKCINIDFPSVGYDWNTMHSMQEMIDKKGYSQKQAANEVAKDRKLKPLNPSTLAVRYSEVKKRGIEFAPEVRALGQVMMALEAAADRLEDTHREAEGPVQPHVELQT